MEKNFIQKAFQFSIRTKILFLGTVLVLFSFVAYVFYVTNAFQKDKESYVQEGSMQESHDVQASLNFILKSKELELQNLTLRDPADLQGDNLRLISKKTGLLQYERYQQDGVFRKVISVIHEPALRNHSLKKYDLSKLTKVPLEVFGSIAAKQKHLELQNIDDIPLVRTYWFDSKNRILHFATFVVDDLGERFESKGAYDNALINLNGTVLLTTGKFPISADLFKVLGNAASEGSIPYTISNMIHYVGHSRLPQSDWVVLSIIPKEVAMSIVQEVNRRSIFFAGIIVSISIILGTLLAQNLTNPIDALVAGTAELSKGNFNHEIKIKNDDELGQLASSFNYMSKELLRYIEEVKVKARMENELAVAQLVQSSFFPDKKVIAQGLSVFGHYSSASECGGDWWGTRTIGDKNLLFIADATGHGVPAALITATANCVANLLPQICESQPELLDSPSKILEYFNSAVYRVGGQILMTFFIGIYDRKTNVLKYANASHNPPYLYRYNEGEPQKSDITLLLDAEGERLGHIENPNYTESSVRMNENDVLVMVTDGIIEAENPEKKQYGERRFLKSILRHVKSTPEEMMEGILGDASLYLEGVKPEDDVTLIVAKRETA